MNFWQNIKAAFQRFMTGRHGADQLSMTLLWVSLALYILSAVTEIGLLSIVAILGYGWTVFRIFSRNNARRTIENEKYMSLRQNANTEIRQARIRFRNRKQYKYLKCPKCRARLRLTRGTGIADVRCVKCGNTFKAKA